MRRTPCYRGGVLSLGQDIPSKVTRTQLNHEESCSKRMPAWNVLSSGNNQPTRRLDRAKCAVGSQSMSAQLIALGAE